jgi:hypothetical protein
MKKVYLALEEIETNGLQTRAQLNMDVVREYAEAEAERGAVFPPVTVFSDGAKHWLADGFHRVAMARQQGKKKIAAEVREGGFAEALTYALAANAAHGLRRSNADKRNAVMVAYKNRIVLGLGEVPAANRVANLVGVSHTFAGLQLATVATWKAATERTGTDGKTYNLPPPPVRRPAPQVTAPESETTAESDPEKASFTPPPTRPPLVRQASAPDPEEGVGSGPENDAPPTPPPARQGPPPQRPQAVTPPPPSRRTAPADDPAMTDGRGRPIPPELAEIWNRRREVAEMARLVGQVRSAVKAAEAGEDPLWAEINYSSALAYLDRSYAEIAAAMPWCVCPMCQGIGCRACKGRGLLGKTRYEAVVPRELKEKS